MKSYPWHAVQSWSFLTWDDGGGKDRRGFSLHVDMQCGEVDRDVVQRSNILQRENMFALDWSVDANGFALVSRRLSAMILKQRKVAGSVSDECEKNVQGDD